LLGHSDLATQTGSRNEYVDSGGNLLVGYTRRNPDMCIRSSSELSLLEEPMMRICSEVMLGLGSLGGHGDAGTYERWVTLTSLPGECG